MKISENVEKITNPGFKKLYRLFDKNNGRMMADVTTLAHENAPAGDDYTIFDTSFTWKRKRLSGFVAKDIRVQVFDSGRRVYESPSIDAIRAHCLEQIGTLWEETLRFENPQDYYVDLSQELWELRTALIERYQNSSSS
jgi:nicotinate phosphoribosyltransferase